MSETEIVLLVLTAILFALIVWNRKKIHIFRGAGRTYDVSDDDILQGQYNYCRMPEVSSDDKQNMCPAIEKKYKIRNSAMARIKRWIGRSKLASLYGEMTDFGHIYGEM